MPTSETRLHRWSIATVGMGAGFCTASLGYELFPSMFAFKDGVNPMLQGALIGAMALFGAVIALIEVDLE
jgi:hypothetical protein